MYKMADHTVSEGFVPLINHVSAFSGSYKKSKWNKKVSWIRMKHHSLPERDRELQQLK
jgi:hypothetical protein